MALGRRAHIYNLQAAALALKLVEILDHLIPSSQLAVGTHLKTEKLLGGSDDIRVLGQAAAEKAENQYKW